jgi:GTP cyclohydrolase I
MELGTQKPNNGDAWNGFEWVSPDKYEEQRLRGLLFNNTPLPPLQAVPGAALRDIDMAAVEARVLAHMLADPEHVVQALLATVIGEDVTRGGLLETPQRAVKAWQHWTSGYRLNPADVLKVFEDGAEGCDEMVVVRDIPVYSHCEHHLAPIFGTATIGYLPDKRIVGLSKLVRLADVFARRLQVQERMTNQIAEALMEHLKPLGCGVVINARHMCMESRGVQCAGTSTITSALRGVFKDDPRVRSEFLELARETRRV